MNDTAGYAAPALSEIGKLHEMTLAPVFHKASGDPDIYSNVVPVIGDLTPAGSSA